MKKVALRTATSAAVPRTATVGAAFRFGGRSRRWWGLDCASW